MLSELLFLTLCKLSIGTQLTDVADVIIAVQKYFRNDYIILLTEQDQDLKASHLGVQVQKLLTKKFETSMSADIHQLDCFQQSPALHVMICDKSNDQQFFSNITSLTTIMGAMWLLFLERDTSLTQFFIDTYIPFNSQFLVAQQHNESIIIMEVYHIRPTLPLLTQRFGTWTSCCGLINSNVFLYQRRKNFQKTVLKTATKSELVIENLFRRYELREDEFFNQVWQTLEDILNFSTEIITPADDVYGKQIENGSWNGIMGLMERREVDATSAVLTIEPKRAEVVDFITPLLQQREYLFIKNSNLFELSWTSFLQPFCFTLWMVLIITMLLLSLSLCTTSQLFHHFENEDAHSDVLNCFLRAFFIIYTSLCRQGISETPRCISGRMVCTVAHLTVTVLLAAYSASLISHLTFRKHVLPFNSFSELLNNPTYKLGVHAASYMSMESSDPTLRKLYFKHISSNAEDLPASNWEGLQNVCTKHKYTYLASLIYWKQYANELPCQITIVPDAFIPETNAMALVKGSPFLGLFRYTIYKLQGTGVLARLYLKVKQNLPDDEPQYEVNMDINSVAPIFAILAVGMVASVAVFIIELSFHKSRKT